MTTTHLSGDPPGALIAMKSSAGLLALCAAGLVAGSAAAPLVHTSNGYVQGTTDNGVDVFHSIPFAAPPTGDRRFRAPAPVSSWSGTKVRASSHR